MADSLQIRPLHRIEDFRAAQTVMAETWGYQDDDVVPVPTLIATNHAGGLVAGAFLEGELVGFCYAFPGHQDGEFLLYSQMTAVHPDHRGRGLGRAIKLYQREWARDQGFRRIRWTFDPLMAANARFNLHLLGATAVRYYVDFYGRSSSPLHGTLPTDRLLADWDLDSPRVDALVRGLPDPLADAPAEPPLPPLFDLVKGPDGREVPGPMRALDPARRPRLTAPVPADFLGLGRTAPEAASAWRMGTRSAFQAALEAGYVFVDFTGPSDVPPGGSEGYLLAAAPDHR
jgi:chorismate synthase